MKQFAEKVLNTVYETNEKGELKQNVRNAFKAELTLAFKDFLKENGFDVAMTCDGVAVQFENTELGAICVVFDPTVKAREYDLETAHEIWLETVAEKARKAEMKAKEKALKIENAEKAKAEKAKKAETTAK